MVQLVCSFNEQRHGQYLVQLPISERAAAACALAKQEECSFNERRHSHYHEQLPISERAAAAYALVEQEECSSE
jgi:hypothetical protein